MVGGTERVAVAVKLRIRNVQRIDEVLGIVVATGVLEGGRLVAVDVPHGGILHQPPGCLVCKNVVEGAQLAPVLVGLLREVLLAAHRGEAAALDRAQRVLHGVAVEVADEERRLTGPIVLLFQVVQQCLGLCDAKVCSAALTIASVWVAVDRALGLEVVDHGDEVVIVVSVDGVEFLGQRLARDTRKSGVVKNTGFANRLHLRRLIDKRDADNVLIGAELRRGLDVVPLISARSCIQGVDKLLQRIVALGDVARDGRVVFNLGQAENVRVQLVNSGDDLRLLVLEGFLAVRAAHVAVVGADLGAVLVGVGLASGLVLAQGGEVVQHVEETDGVVAFDGVRHVVGRRARILPRDRQFLGGVLPGDRLQRLETPLVEGVVDHHVGLEVHLIAGADRLHTVVGGDEVRQRRVLVGAEVVAGAAVVEVHNLGCLLRVHLGNFGLVRRDHVGRVAERLLARCQAEVAGVVQRVVVGHRVRASRAHEHALVRLAGVVTGGKRVNLHSLRCFQRFVERA